MMAVPSLFFAVFDSSPCLRHDRKPRKLSLPRGRLGRFEDTVLLGYQNRKNLSISNSGYSTLSAIVSLAAAAAVSCIIGCPLHQSPYPHPPRGDTGAFGERFELGPEDGLGRGAVEQSDRDTFA